MQGLPMDGYVPLPPLPARISRLNDLASDLWWSWNAAAREVFRDLDLPLWRFTDHNPVLLLHLVEPERLAHAAGDPEFLHLYDEAIASLDAVRAGAGTWWSRLREPSAESDVLPVACVAPGFSLHQALPLDSDGTAIAAGDAAKEASDLGVPFVGIGMMYPRAYLHQRISADGLQQETYEHLDWSDAPVSPALCPDGAACAFSQPVDGQPIHVRVWQVRVGRVRLYLLDTDVPENTDGDRAISAAAELPSSGPLERRTRIMNACAPRALALLGIQPSAVVSPAEIGAGVHVPTWIARDIAALIEEHAGADWRDHQDDGPWWERAAAIPDDALWSARQRLRGFLLDFIRERARRRWTREQATGARLVGLGTLLDPATLTIGVAQRFTAAYDADAIFHDVERLAAMLTAPRRPVQIIFAGRAHRSDTAGKQALQRVFTRALDPRFAGRIAFLDDYDLHAARLLVQGCDLWVSLARTGEEPLGPAKAAINGVPSLRLDAALPERAAARGFYTRLEDDIVPAFYHRDRRGVPVHWIGRVSETFRAAIPAVCARRALKRSVEGGKARADV
jgi:glucan phosphorylase